MAHYFIDATLLNHTLITLEKYYINPIPNELKANCNITVKLLTNGKYYSYPDCHIDNTNERRLNIPDEIMVWIRKTYPFSVAYFLGDRKEKWQELYQGKFYNTINEVDELKSLPQKSKDIIINSFNELDIKPRWKKKIFPFFNEIMQKKCKMDVPRETLIISWETSGDGTPYLLISEGFRITTENATKYLSEKALASILPYIFSSIKNTSISESREEGKKCYIIDRTTDWLSVKQYNETAFSHPGIYLLRRNTDNGYCYYVGKATDIKNRIKKNDNKISHPEEKDEENKQYDHIACISINFDDLKRLYGVLNDSNCTEQFNPPVGRGSDTDNALYAVEDVIIHAVAMIMRSEGKNLDNKQYRSYTSEWLNNKID